MTSLIMYAHCGTWSKWSNRPHNRGFVVSYVPRSIHYAIRELSHTVRLPFIHKISLVANKLEPAAWKRWLKNVEIYLSKLVCRPFCYSQRCHLMWLGSSTNKYGSSFFRKRRQGSEIKRSSNTDVPTIWLRTTPHQMFKEHRLSKFVSIGSKQLRQ